MSTAELYSELNQQGECPSKSGALGTDKHQEEQQDGHQEEVIAHDKATAVVVLGAYVAVSLIGIIICAPAFIVVLFGAGVAGLCFQDGKAGDFARKVGEGTSNVFLATVRMGCQLNDKYKLSDKAKEAAQQMTNRVKEADEKHGLTQKMKAKASSVWAAIDKQAGGAHQNSQAQVESVRNTDDTENPFDGADKKIAHKTDQL